jgi:starch phosphorylase
MGGVRAHSGVLPDPPATPPPEVFHTNEGHAGFLGLERIREYLHTGLDFDTALELTRAGTVFTTHTPVPPASDRFPRELIVHQFAGFDGLPLDRVLALGAEDYEGGDTSKFNMAVMGFRLSQRANGVSALHGIVSREMFQGCGAPLTPARCRSPQSPTACTISPGCIGVARSARGAERQSVGERWLRLGPLSNVDSKTIWALKRRMREDLIAMTRERLAASGANRGLATDWVAKALNPDVLTFGFARRVPSYKRLTLMLRDPDRLKALLTDKDRPIQIVIAGKAHPADEGGKALVQQVVQFADDHACGITSSFSPTTT